MAYTLHRHQDMNNATTNGPALSCPHCGVYYMSGMSGICTVECKGSREAEAARQARMPAPVDLDSIELDLPDRPVTLCW